MKIIRYSNPEISDVTCSLNSEIEFGDTELNVDDASDFSANDLILIDNIGSEFCEIRKISNIVGNKINISESVEVYHIIGTEITKISYDQVKIKKGSSNNVNLATDLVTLNLRYDDIYNNIYYIDIDENASDSLYYYLYFYNSVTESAVYQTSFHNELNYGYIDVANYRAETSFTSDEVSDSEIQKAIYNSLEWIQDNCYVYKEFQGFQGSVFELPIDMFMADWNGDCVIDKNDIIIYEIDSTDNNKYRYLNSEISKVIYDTGKIIFKQDLPINTQNNYYIKIPLCSKNFSEIKYSLKTISKLMATNYILMNVDTSKIKSGITTWSAGGVNVQRDVDNIKNSIKKNLEEALRIKNQIAKIYSLRTKLRTQNSSLNYRQQNNNNNLAYKYSTNYNKY